MRQLKFRAWCDVQKKLNYFTMGELIAGREIEDHPEEEDDDYFDDGCGFSATQLADYTKDKTPIEQFTGLTDKNGREIYEGDIVRYRNIYRDGHPYLTNVIKDMFNAAFHDRNWTSESEPEIIGNIHENPELIGSEQL